MIDMERYDRQIGLFGAAGQRRISAARVAIVGLGGLGSHLVQQLAYLGVSKYALIDGDQASSDSFNRLITGTPADAGKYKTDLAERLIYALVPGADICNVRHDLAYPGASAAFDGADLIIGGVDNDAARLQLTDYASQRQIVYIDAASDVHMTDNDLVYGGRLVTAGTTRGCLFCLDLLDQREIRLANMTTEQLEAEEAIYGVPVEELGDTGPSVVTINGVVASLVATEAMVFLTRLRSPVKQLVYRGDQGGVRVSLDGPVRSSCPYCSRWLQA
jgi:hypothetical protein